MACPPCEVRGTSGTPFTWSTLPSESRHASGEVEDLPRELMDASNFGLSSQPVLVLGGSVLRLRFPENHASTPCNLNPNTAAVRGIQLVRSSTLASCVTEPGSDVGPSCGYPVSCRVQPMDNNRAATTIKVCVSPAERRFRTGSCLGQQYTVVLTLARFVPQDKVPPIVPCLAAFGGCRDLGFSPKVDPTRRVLPLSLKPSNFLNHRHRPISSLLPAPPRSAYICE